MPENTYTDRELDEKFHALGAHMKTFERDVRNSQTRIEITLKNGFDGVHERQDKTNGRVRWAEKMIWFSIGGMGVITVLVIPVLLTLIKYAKL